MRYTQIPSNTFEQLQLNAGILLSSFTPATGSFNENAIIGATSGGANFKATPSFIDFGEDIDNCPKNTKELKEIDDIEVKLTGTFLQVSTASAKRLAGAADAAVISEANADLTVTKVTPRKTLEDTDFSDIWWVGDYGKGVDGYIAIHLMNGLSTGGFEIQTGDKAKGTMPFEITGHYSIDAQDTIPYELYIGVPAE